MNLVGLHHTSKSSLRVQKSTSHLDVNPQQLPTIINPTLSFVTFTIDWEAADGAEIVFNNNVHPESAFR
jgi:hypothetical protein